MEEGHLLADHGHMLLSIPPKHAVADVVISLVTGVLDVGALCLDHLDLCAPRARPVRRIVDRKFIEDRVGIDGREAFHNVQSLCRSMEARLVREVLRLDA